MPRRIAGRLFFFPRAKTQSPAFRRQLQRNCARSVFLPEAFAAWHICSLPRRIAGSQILFLFFTRAKAQRRKGITFHPPLVPCLSTAGRPLKPTITVKNALFKNFFARTILISKNLHLPLTHHQEPVYLVPTESNTTVVKR